MILIVSMFCPMLPAISGFAAAPTAGTTSRIIDFTDPAAAEQFEVVNKKNAAIVEGTGLTLTCTRPAFEDCNGQNSGDQATNPQDVVSIPVNGDWTATMKFKFGTGKIYICRN